MIREAEIGESRACWPEGQTNMPFVIRSQENEDINILLPSTYSSIEWPEVHDNPIFPDSAETDSGSISETTQLPGSFKRSCCAVGNRCVVFATVSLLLLLLVIGIAVAISVVLTAEKKEKVKVQPLESSCASRDHLKVTDFEGSVRMTAMKWDSAMADNRTDIFRRTASGIEGWIDEIFRASNMSDIFQCSLVTRLREGSVIAFFRLLLMELSDVTNPAGREILQDVLAHPHLLKAAFFDSKTNIKSASQDPTMSVSDFNISNFATQHTATVSQTVSAQRTTKATTFSSSTTPANKPPCGRVHLPQQHRIVGGNVTDEGMYPWIVMIRINSSFQCGGSIMDPLHIITSAHCFMDFSTARLNQSNVVAGQIKLDTRSEHTQQIPIARIYMHEAFNERKKGHFDSYLNDIAVVKLSAPLTLNSHVFPVCLPRDGDTLPPQCLVAGWGSTIPSGRGLSNELQTVQLWTYNNTACQQTFGSTFSMFGDDIGNYLSDGVMCAANHNRGGMDACEGDSGGPLFCVQEDDEALYTQYGVVSWGNGCASPTNPGFYAYLPYFRTWLEHTALPALDAVLDIEVI